MPAADTVDRRFSTRIYYRRPIAAGVQQRLSGFMAARTTGPLGSQARFELLAATVDDRRVLRRLGTRHTIKNATGFVVGAVQAAPHDLEDYGYLLEEIVLCATGLGLGTCWLGGTFRRSAFVRRFGGLQPGETMPAVVATGYGSEDGTARVRLRKENDRRLPAGELFFDGRFGEPLTASRAGRYAAALEAVRMGPSNRNAQPWRIVRGGGDAARKDAIDAPLERAVDAPLDWHFYLQRTDGSGQGDIVTRTLRIADLERVALGIAMCHFELVAREAGLDGRWVVDDPGLDLPYGAEYTATWRSGPHERPA